MTSRILRVAGAAVAIVATVALTACSPSANVQDRPAAASSSFQGEVPEFTGPWAAEFAEAYRSTTSEVVHKILAKGSITDQDYASVSSQFVTCMKDKGFAVEITGPYGESTVSGDGDINAGANACNDDMAVISALRFSTTRNPQHLDENTIMVACLHKKKLVPPSYSTKDYEADLQTQKFPFSVDSADFLACTGDPLGLSAGK
ncbi:hypothetical protein [Leifsonia sp. 21MFCrub1.1]|uniref:hypothetical protein n=1 Tax=Leifsonia sp. 21MFCrub1.1 TaxID=1798223 RepID=UPI0008928FC2|nr:hypothetical protein [Leifsonia sp. 21MFCrub1.1]SEA65465.1 hypothetical protein SAMN04515680_1070 [Leifsonia sp. 21MFCrub1.1]